MPVEPPVLLAPKSFQPVHVTEEDLQDLSTFTGMARDACLERLNSYSLTEHAQAWATANPKTPSEILSFYQKTDLYIWELMQWHASAARQPYWEALAYVVDHYRPEDGWRRVYDFGCGIGTDALYLASKGYDVTLVDVDSPTLRFAKHRFQRRGLQGRFVESTEQLPSPDGEYDVVLCFDVFEHLPDPVRAAARLAKALKSRGLLVQQGGFVDEGYHPCHLRAGLSRFAGLRWHVHLAGLGLQHITGLIYQRESGLRQLRQRARYALWRLTGVWIARLS